MDMMIVDDSMIIRNRIERALESCNLNIVGVAENGVQAVDIVTNKKPKFVTMDLTMPEMDGSECIEEILKIDPSLIILVVSALSDKATAIQAMKKGAHGFLCKPFTEKELTNAIAKLLEE
ncbi:MAG: response regulator [Marinicellaceae bacterium]